MCVYICMYVYVCMYVCVYVCMYVCMYVYYTVLLVPGDPLISYHEHFSSLRLLYIICASARLNSVSCRVMPSGGVP